MKYNLQPRIVESEEMLCAGMSTKMSVVNNKTGELWRRFAPQVGNIDLKKNGNKISLQVYSENYFQAFNPNAEFLKWALVEIDQKTALPPEMDFFIIPGGEYAVFDYIGASNDSSIFQYIYSQWVPLSEYELDDRPHFEVLGLNYKNNDPNSEEEIWIPIKPKN